MAIAEQFAGLEMDKLIGAPLAAAADASLNLATGRIKDEPEGKT